jgi:hypothetical protein
MQEFPHSMSFSTFKTEDPFEEDQMALFLNYSSERASLAFIRDQLDQAFEALPFESFKFKRLPVDPFEFENKPELYELPDHKHTPDPFCQLFSIPKSQQVKGRLRLKPITPDTFGRRMRAPMSMPGGNILDDLKKELGEATSANHQV